MSAHIPFRRTSFGIILAVICWPLLSCSFAEAAVADEKVSTLQYIETSGYLKGGPEYVRHVMILDRCLKRTIYRRKPADGFPVGELPEPNSNDPYGVDDAKNGKRVYVVPDKREFKRITSSMAYWKNALGKVQRHAMPVQPDPDEDFEGELRQPVPIEKAHKQLPERIVDGHQAIGYQIRRFYLNEGMSTTIYWVDTRTQLPVRIEHHFKPVDPKEDMVVRIQRNIIFDAPLDKSLFSTDPPPGYSVLPNSDEVIRRLFGAGP